jgi:hypothetical protein
MEGPTRPGGARGTSATRIGAAGASALALALLSFGVGAAQAGRAAVSSASSASTRARLAALSDQPAMAVSPNWSGYVATGQPGSPVSYSSVTGTWVVPTATCATGSAGGFSTVWVGLGGYTSKNQEEVGTDTNCDATGKPIYYAWFELVPYPAYNVPVADRVLPGDTITGLVQILSTTLVELQIVNQTRGWSFSRNITFSSQDTTTAEWIAEAPAACLRFVCHEANLANFGTVTMSNLSAVGNGSEGTLTDPDWNVTPVQLVPTKLTVPTLNPDAPGGAQGQASSPAGATPGPHSDDGKSFSITWVKTATAGL